MLPAPCWSHIRLHWLWLRCRDFPHYSGIVGEELMEEVRCMKAYANGNSLAAGRGLGRWFDGYNRERPHEALGYATPADAYFDPGAHGAQPAKWEAMQPEKGGGHRKT